MSDVSFHDAYVAARQRIDSGDDPEPVVPGLLAVAEAPEEIELAEGAVRGRGGGRRWRRLTPPPSR